MAGLGRISIGMTVLDRFGTLVGVVKALQLDEGVKPATSLVLDGIQAKRLLEAGARADSGGKVTHKGYLLIEACDGEEIVAPLDSISRVAATAVHLAVARRNSMTGNGSGENV